MEVVTKNIIVDSRQLFLLCLIRNKTVKARNLEPFTPTGSEISFGTDIKEFRVDDIDIEVFPDRWLTDALTQAHWCDPWSSYGDYPGQFELVEEIEIKEMNLINFLGTGESKLEAKITK